jgi:hypothetical protein
MFRHNGVTGRGVDPVTLAQVAERRLVNVGHPDLVGWIVIRNQTANKASCHIAGPDEPENLVFHELGCPCFDMSHILA